MRVGLVQMNSQQDKEENLLFAERMIADLADEGTDMVLLPEYFNFYGSWKLWSENAEVLDSSPSLERLRAAAATCSVAVHCGSFLEREGGRIYNTSVVFSADGKRIATYRKIHLFDAETPAGQRYCESDTVTAGSEVQVFEYGSVVFGMATCYDLRFPELFRCLVDQGAQVILIPAAFTASTGADHWQLLLRARAVENLCYVVAAAQYGNCSPSLESYGHSMVIDPWGVVTAQAGDGEQSIFSNIDISFLRGLRKRFPVLSHRRRDIFEKPERHERKEGQ